MCFFIRFLIGGILIFGVRAPHSGENEGTCPFMHRTRRSLLANVSQSHTVCDSMRPRGGIFPEQKTPSPWKIYIFRNKIESLHAQPVTLGSENSSAIFNGYLITAKKLVAGGDLGDFLGHFEPQWDAIPHCCADAVSPNMLDGSLSARVKSSNQTLLWTAPSDYFGQFVFLATIWQTVNQYWFEIKSPVLTVIPRKKI